MERNTQGFNTINKPIMLLKDDFTNEMTDLINKSGLPLFVIEPILKDFLREVNAELRKQYEYEKMQYELALKNAESAKGEQDDRETISEEIRKDSTQE